MQGILSICHKNEHDMANVCDSKHQHHVDPLAAFVDSALIIIYELKLHQEYYYTFYV